MKSPSNDGLLLFLTALYAFSRLIPALLTSGYTTIILFNLHGGVSSISIPSF
jgi:hypothetical protein